MSQKTKLHFITGNNHKYREVKNFLEMNFPNFEVIQQKMPLKELQGDSLEEIAKFKISSVSDLIQPPYFIEDAGFFVDDYLKGFPGVYSSYVMKTIGYNGILRLLGDIKDRRAHFEAVIAYRDKNNEIHLFKGVNEGRVAWEPRGDSGFGFDPIFISDNSAGKTFAEISIEEKNKISHRTRAIKKFVEFLSENM